MSTKANELIKLLGIGIHEDDAPEKTSDMFGNFMQQFVRNMFDLKPDQIKKSTTENTETMTISYPDGSLVLNKLWDDAIVTLQVSVEGKAPENLPDMISKLAEFARKFGWKFQDNTKQEG